MEVYVILLILAIVCCFLPKRLGTPLGLLVMLFGFGICAFRNYHIGSDTPMYLEFYEHPYGRHIERTEFLFKFIASALNEFGVQSFDVQVIMALITWVPLIILFLRESRSLPVSFLVFIVSVMGYYMETLNLVRQLASLPYILWAYVFLQKKQLRLCLLFSVIAMGLHAINVAAVAVMILATKVRPNEKVVYVSIILTLIYAFCFSSIEFMKGLANQFAGMGYFAKYVQYATYAIKFARNLNGLLPLLVPSSLLCMASYRLLVQEDKKVLANVFFYGCVILNIVSIFPTSYRMGMNMICVELLIYPIMIARKGKYRTFAISMIVLMMAYYLFRLVTWDKCVPYVFAT